MIWRSRKMYDYYQLSLSQGRSRIPRAWFTPITISSHWGTIGRLGELILMLKNLIKWHFHAMGPLSVFYQFSMWGKRLTVHSSLFLISMVFTELSFIYFNITVYALSHVLQVQISKFNFELWYFTGDKFSNSHFYALEFCYSFTFINNLPDNVRGSDTLSQFKSRLKTQLFSQAFN